MSQPECPQCSNTDKMLVCNSGELYGPCEHPSCGGWCEPVGVCECDCHKAEVQP